MAVIVYDGFDHYTSQTDIQARSSLLSWSDIELVGSGAVTMATGRGGYGRSVAINTVSASPAVFGGSFGAYLTTGCIGIASLFEPTGMPYVDYQVMDYTNNVAQITVRFLIAGGIVQVYSGDPSTTPAPHLIGQSPPNAFSPYIWNYVEIGCTIGASGTFDVHVQGNSVVSGSGATQYPAPLPNGNLTPATAFSGFRVRGPINAQSSVSFQLDDFYLCDNTTGPGTFPANGFLGDTAVRTLYPTANSSVSWTPLAGTNFSEVNASQFDGDASYNSAVAVGSADTFTFGQLPTTVSAVYAVQVTSALKKGDASAQTVLHKVVSGGTTGAGAAFPIGLGYAYYTSLFVTDPHTSATWTPAGVNALIAGYQLAS